MELLQMTWPGDPVAKGRPRVTRTGHAFTPQKTKDAEAALREAVMDKVSSAHDGPVGVAVEFYCATNRRTDGDNMFKLVTDALNKVVYLDDSQILEGFYRVHRKVAGEEPRTEIFIYTLSDDDTQDALL